MGENVSGHIKLGLDTVLSDLESEGYSARTFSISASSIGANHKRERVWIVANSNDRLSNGHHGGITSMISTRTVRASPPTWAVALGTIAPRQGRQLPGPIISAYSTWA